MIYHKGSLSKGFEIKEIGGILDSKRDLAKLESKLSTVNQSH